MTQPPPLELAKQGNPQAIAALINKTLQPQGFKAQVAKQGGVLKVLVQGQTVPDQGKMVSFIVGGVEKLGIAGLEEIQVFGRQAGSDKPAWGQKVSLTSQRTVDTEQVLTPTDSQPPSTSPREETEEPSATADQNEGFSISCSGCTWIVAITFGFLVGVVSYCSQQFSTPQTTSQQTQRTETPSQPQSGISSRAASLKTGMSYPQVIGILGRMPDTVVNDQIRQELGEPAQGNDLITFEWRNDNPDCQPVTAQFNPSGMTLTGWNEGRTCTGASIFNEPFGKPCAESTLCKPN